MTDQSFPYPIPEYGAEPFWDACNQEMLVMQRCDDCAHFRWQPAPMCGTCQSTAFRWVPLAGTGKVATWTVITHPVHPAAVARVPYIVADIELDEQVGLRMISNLVGIEPDEVEFDLRVAVAFTTHPNGQKLPVFKPAG